MWRALRRLWLGLTLIGMVAAILLLSDWTHRSSTGAHLPRVAVFQYASRPILDDGVQGALDALRERGFEEGRTISLERFNSQNDLPTANSIAKGIVGRFDLVVTVSTPILQTMAAANRDGKVKHIFGLVTDPSASGVGINPKNPLDHPKHLAGVGTFQPVREALELAKRMNPGLKRLGIVWNVGETCSEACTRVARATCKELGITLDEAQVENSAGVLEAATSLVSRNVQAIFIGGDNTVEMAMNSVIKAANQGHIPVFACAPIHANLGALAGLGANYYEVGRAIGNMAADVLAGRLDPAAVRIENVLPKKLGLNLTALKGLRERWEVPPEVRESAAILIDEDGKRTERGAAGKSQNAALSKKWNVHLIELVDAPAIENSRKGVLAGLKESGLVEGRDYTVKVRNAQGDMTTLNSLVDAAVTENADMVYTITTPALQTAMKKVSDRPLLFTLALDPLLVGDGGSHEKHRANVAGIYDRSPFEEMFKLVKECLPGVRKVGTLFAPGEANSVNFRDEMLKAGRAAGLEVVAVPSSSPAEVSDSALALMQRGIGAVCQINDNLHDAAFPTIALAARRARIPIFSFSTGQMKQGAAVALSNDHFDGGRESGLIAAQVMRGQSPGAFPYRGISKTRLLVNQAAARAVNFEIPAAVVQRAERLN